MESQNKEIISKLASEHPELQTLLDQHQAYEEQLVEMKCRSYLSAEDDLECKRIQKAKLGIKDQIQTFVVKHSA